MKNTAVLEIDSPIDTKDLQIFFLRNINSIFIVLFLWGLLLTVTNLPTLYKVWLINSQMNIFMVVVWLIGIYIPIGVLLKIKKTFKEKLENNLKLHYKINDSGVYISLIGNSQENLFSWDSFYCVKEQREAYYFHTDKSNAFILPKRFFSNGFDERLLHKLCIKNLKKEQRKLTTCF